MKKIIIALIVIIIVSFGLYVWMNSPSSETVPTNTETATTTVNTTSVATTTKDKTVIGKSVEGRDIVAYHYGQGTSTEILFVGGIHGGYEWNTSLVSYELMDYLKTSSSSIPQNLKVTVIPVVNPDGLYKVVGKEGVFTASDVTVSNDILVSGRFNANNVDLNRNFDCDWQEKGVWQNKTVDGGSKAFSEPESQAVKSYIEKNTPTAAIVWYSAVGGVFSSNCHNGVSAGTKNLTDLYAKASGYRAYKEFNFYEITGDMVNWLAKNNIPAISVLLTNHTDTEWSKNKAGIDAVLKYYSK